MIQDLLNQGSWAVRNSAFSDQCFKASVPRASGGSILSNMFLVLFHLSLVQQQLLLHRHLHQLWSNHLQLIFFQFLEQYHLSFQLQLELVEKLVLLR